MVADLTALPVAGASLLDEATAAAEAMTLARRAAGQGPDLPGRRRLPAADAGGACHPGRAARHRAAWSAPVTAELIEAQPDGELFGVLLQYPGASGAVRDLRPVIAAARDRGAVAAVAADLLALTLLMPPGELGADIAVGTTQRFGVPMGFGGPHAAYIAVRDGLRSASCPAGWSAYRSTRTATPPTGSRCRPASSTSAGRRRPATSARRRCCWP